MINSIDNAIITAMARTLFTMAWADWAEQLANCRFPPGTKIEDVAPSTPPEVLHLAYFLAGRLLEKNTVLESISSVPGALAPRPRWDSMMLLFRHALIADGKSWAGMDEEDPLCAEFGSDLAMMIAGQGVSWFDDHADFNLRMPDFEWTYLHLDQMCTQDQLKNGSTHRFAHA